MAEEQFSKDTSTRTVRDWCQGLLVLFAGLVIAHFGVTLFLISEMGTDTFTVFIQGLATRIGISIGTCHVGILLLLMLVMLVGTKGYVKPVLWFARFVEAGLLIFFFGF